MENRLDFSEVPYEYPLCLNRQCDKASTCLRQLAEQSVTDDIIYWSIISPRHLATVKGSCPYYRSAAKVRFAKGFKGILENISNKQMREVVSHLISTFSRRTYYRIRKGERLLSPAEQEEIEKILRHCGVTDQQEFDAYTEEYEW